MTIAELGEIAEFVASIAVLVTPIYLSIQIRQSTILVWAFAPSFATPV